MINPAIPGLGSAKRFLPAAYAVAALFLSGLAGAPLALAQTPSAAAAQTPGAPVEQVIVTAPKYRETLAPIIDHFIGSYTAPTRVIGKIARWQDGICPLTVGFRPELNIFIANRIKEVAAMIGAPVQAKQDCKVNVLVVINPKPQALLDEIRVKYPYLLGYSDGRMETRRLATVSHPIQAWYATETEDYLGAKYIDNAMQCGGQPCYMNGIASWLNNGLSSQFTNVVIVADADKIIGYEAGAIADYIAMLTLSQTKAFDACEELPTIANLVSPDCDAGKKANALTDSDIAYLRALYKMNGGDNLDLQKRAIARQMEQSLEGQ